MRYRNLTERPNVIGLRCDVALNLLTFVFPPSWPYGGLGNGRGLRGLLYHSHIWRFCSRRLWCFSATHFSGFRLPRRLLFGLRRCFIGSIPCLIRFLLCWCFGLGLLSCPRLFKFCHSLVVSRLPRSCFGFFPCKHLRIVPLLCVILGALHIFGGKNFAAWPCLRCGRSGRLARLVGVPRLLDVGLKVALPVVVELLQLLGLHVGRKERSVKLRLGRLAAVVDNVEDALGRRRILLHQRHAALR